MKKSVGLRLSENDKRLVECLANKLGVSQADVYVIAIRNLAKQEKIK